jgi:RHS repeat-associated protein
MDDGSYLKAIRVGNCCPYFETPESIAIILRLEKHGEDYIFKYKHDPNEAWTAISPISIEETPVYVGLISRVITTGDEEMNLDWSYFRLERWEDEENFMMAPGGGAHGLEGGEQRGSPGSDEKKPTSTPTRQPTATITRTPSPTGTATPQAIDLAPGGPDYAVHFAPVGFNLPPGKGLPHEDRVPVGPLAVPHLQTISQTIDYTYDPLYRLTDAEYSNGDYFHYTYDAVGNRVYQESSISSLPSDVDYLYDAANRLIDVNDVEYTWDDNGNLLDDEVDEYTYDGANRLSSVSGVHESSYVYNGLGDRLQRTVDSSTTTYVLDLNAGPTQVLDDGIYSYTYGLSRIRQDGGSETDYFLGDALGSVRQMIDGSGAVTYAASYTPYGEALSSVGEGASVYGFTGEQTDDVTGMVYLRARYYTPTMARFMTRDTWGGDKKEPMSYNGWLYVYANPVNLTDPSGMFPNGDESGNEAARFIIQRMREDSNSEVARIIYQLNTTHYYINACNTYRQMPWWGKIAIGGSRYLANAEFTDIAARDEASVMFGCRVADARSRPICGQWDYKKDIREIWGEAQTVDFSDIGIDEEVIFYYDVWANFHYGYVGSALGFSEQALLSGAAYEHAISNININNLVINIQDDPSDIMANIIGINLYRSHNLTERSLLWWIYIQRNELNKAEMNADGTIKRIYR